VDARRLVREMAEEYPTWEKPVGDSLTVFLTGATGFLGVHLLSDLLHRRIPCITRVIVHVRAVDEEAGLHRLQRSCQAYGVWREEWRSRITCFTGHLEELQLGLAEKQWEWLAREADVVIHNGAEVHWVKPYSTLRAVNVRGTLEALALCIVGKPKRLTFISSTSVMDSEHVRASVKKGESGVLEADDLMGSASGLATGYGQTKWVSEYLVREAGRRGLSGAIIRPGVGEGRFGQNYHCLIFSTSPATNEQQPPTLTTSLSDWPRAVSSSVQGLALTIPSIKCL